MNQPTFDEIITFVNHCFKKEFKQLQPKIYKHPEMIKYHHWIREENQLLGLLATIPIQLKTPTTTLNGIDIGSVCVDPNYRRQGIMTKLIQDCESLFLTQDFICLSNRERYERFGFGLGGFDFIYEISRIESSPIYHFEEMTQKDDWLTYCWQLHQKQPYHFKRDHTKFLEILQTAKAQAYFILKNNQCLGYLVFAPKYNYISEIIVPDLDTIQSIINDFLIWTNQNHIRISYQYGEANPFQAQIPVQIQPLKRFRIINYPKVIKSLLSWKQTLTPLTSGTLRLEIHKQATYQITVDNTQIIVIESTQTADLKLTELETEDLLLWNHQSLPIPPEQKALCDNWFPLPIVIKRSDFH